MSGITMALNITKRLDKKNSSVSDKTEIPETKFSSLHKECIPPLTNESYYSFVGGINISRLPFDSRGPTKPLFSISSTILAARL